jgi:anti-sigma factor RsiW
MERARLQDLIQADLDGELSVAERAGLARLLLRDPQARSLHDDFRQTDRLLRDIPAAEPPAGLRAAILARSELSPRAGSTGRRAYDRPLFRMAAAVLGGLLIVGIAYLLRDGSGAGTELQGSLGRAGSRMAGPAASQDRLSMRAAGAAPAASLRRVGQTLRLDLGLAATIPCEIVASVDPSTTTLVGSSGDAQLSLAQGQVTIDADVGRRDLVLDFAGTAPVRLELRSSGRLLAEGSLSVSDP